MRISYVGPLPPIPGGIAQHGAHLVNGFRRQGHEVDTWSWASQYPGWLYKGEKRDRSSQPFDGTEFSLRWWNPISWFRVGRAARSADLVIVQWVTPFHGVQLGTLMRVTRPTPTICIVHNVVPHERIPLARALTRFALSATAHAIVHSSSQLDELQRLLPELSAHRFQLPPHLVRSRRDPVPDRPPLRLLLPGYVRPYKGVEVAIYGVLAYLQRHPDRPIELSILGDFWSPTKDEVQALVDSLHLQNAVRIEDGYLSDSAMLDEIASHHAALLPYTDATQSGIIPAVLAAGRPVISTRVGGLAEQVRDGLDSLLCPPNDPEAIADAIESLDTRYETYQRAAATAWASDAWDQIATDITQIIRDASL